MDDGRRSGLRWDQSGQSIVFAAVLAGALALILLLVVNLGGVLLTLTAAQNTLRDAARAGALAGDGQDGGLYLDQTAAAEAAQAVFDAGVAQVSGWLAGAPSLDVESLNPPAGGCSAFGDGATCYRRPAVRLRTRIIVNALLGAWAPVSFDLETVVVSGVGHPLTISTPAPAETPAPVSTEVVGASGVVWPTPIATANPTATVGPTTTSSLAPTVGTTATSNPTATRSPSTATVGPTPTDAVEPTATLESPLWLPVSP